MSKHARHGAARPVAADPKALDRWLDMRGQDALGYPKDPTAIELQNRRLLRAGLAVTGLAIVVGGIAAASIYSGIHADESRPAPVWTTVAPYSPSVETTAASVASKSAPAVVVAPVETSSSASPSTIPSLARTATKAAISPSSSAARPMPTHLTASPSPSAAESSASAGATCEMVGSDQVGCSTDIQTYQFWSGTKEGNEPGYMLPAHALATINCATTDGHQSGAHEYNITFEGKTDWIFQANSGPLCEDAR